MTADILDYIGSSNYTNILFSYLGKFLNIILYNAMSNLYSLLTTYINFLILLFHTFSHSLRITRVI